MDVTNSILTTSSQNWQLKLFPGANLNTLREPLLVSKGRILFPEMHTHALLEECNCKEALHYASMLLRYGSVAGLGEASLARFVFLAVNIIYKNDIDPRHDMVIREFIISKYQCIKFAY